MRLSAQDFIKIQKGLVELADGDSYPLKIICIELGTRLGNISGPANLPTTIHRIIMWAETKDLPPMLVAIANGMLEEAGKELHKIDVDFTVYSRK